MIVPKVSHASSFPKKIRFHIAGNFSTPEQKLEGPAGCGCDRVGIGENKIPSAKGPAFTEIWRSLLGMLKMKAMPTMRRNCAPAVAVAGLLSCRELGRVRPAAVLTGCLLERVGRSEGGG
jgi:hypothetical protein